MTIRHAQAADFMVAMETSCGLAEKERRDESLGEKEESVLVVCFQGTRVPVATCGLLLASAALS